MKPAPPAAAPKPLMDKVGVYYVEHSRTCIVISFGRKYIHAVAYTNPLSVIELPRDAQLRPVLKAGAPYSIQDAAKRMMDSPFGRTDRVTRILTNLCNNEAVTEEEAACAATEQPQSAITATAPVSP